MAGYCLDTPDPRSSVPGRRDDLRHRLRRRRALHGRGERLRHRRRRHPAHGCARSCCARRPSRWRTSCRSCTWSNRPAPTCCKYRVEGFIHGGASSTTWRGCRPPAFRSITVVHGSSTAGGAYMPGLSDYVDHGARPRQGVPRRAAAAQSRDRRDRHRRGTRRRRDAHARVRPGRIPGRGRCRRIARQWSCTPSFSLSCAQLAIWIVEAISSTRPRRGACLAGKPPT